MDKRIEKEWSSHIQALTVQVEGSGANPSSRGIFSPSVRPQPVPPPPPPEAPAERNIPEELEIPAAASRRPLEPSGNGK